MMIDPVCGMDVDEKSTDQFSSQYGGQTFNFCSQKCKDAFEQSPEVYARRSASLLPSAFAGRAELTLSSPPYERTYAPASYGVSNIGNLMSPAGLCGLNFRDTLCSHARVLRHFT